MNINTEDVIEQRRLARMGKHQSDNRLVNLHRKAVEALLGSTRWQTCALSPMTLPHGLVRVLFAEQLYRAHSLLHNHPYHRE